MDFNEDQRYKERAWNEFDRARNKARTSRMMSLLTKGCNDLPTLARIRELVKPQGECYAGCKTIPVEKIVGSEDRRADFNKDFMPRKKFMINRWCSVARASYQGRILPPIKVIEVGGVYFVRDGNHRVSVARLRKFAYIDADVTRLSSGVDLDSVTALTLSIASGKSHVGKHSAA